jgi:hypothetical protein
MQKTLFKILFITLLSANTTQAQELYMPRNIKHAYQKGTRSPDGKPGKQYWQNHGQYQIALTVTPEDKTITGTEKIAYSNNSPDTLKTLVIRFVNNLHKPESPRAGQVSPDFLSKGLTITAFEVNGEKYIVNSRNWGTVGEVDLKKPLLPGQQAKIQIDWNYPLSKESGREGQIDSTTFFAAYAYPRVTVYDDYNGWDRIPHTDRGEFYNDFNDYTLAVKAPKNYVVWATGDLLNPDEVLNPKFAAKLKQSYLGNEVISIATAEEMSKGMVTKQKPWNTWKFQATNISDITFSLSNHYVWDAASVVVDKKTGRRASVQSAYNQKAKDFTGTVNYGVQALNWFSNNWPGVAYPFSKLTVFQGFADMEYPMMVNDSSTPDPQFTQFVLNHEVAHTYFPFYMGINETRYAFMDEGWATTLEYLIGIDQIGKTAADKAFQDFRVKRWIFDPSTEEDQPVISLSSQVSGSGYGNNAYVKPALAYLALKDMLGDEVFKGALHTYMDRWNGKHPIPWDFFFTINDATKTDLNWYWNNWFFSNHYIDLAMERVAIKGNNYRLTVKNIGGFAVPFDVKVKYADGKEQVFHQTPAVWKSNQQQAMITITGESKILWMELDGGIFMDAKPNDNGWRL